MTTLRDVIEKNGLDPHTRSGDPWQEAFEFDLGSECRIEKKAEDYTVYWFEGGWLWDGPNSSILAGEDEDGWHGLECIADNGEGDERVQLYRDTGDEAIHVSNNAVTKELVRQGDYAGPGWDDLDVAEWLVKLAEEFGSRDAAIVFAKAALGEDRVEQAVDAD